MHVISDYFNLGPQLSDAHIRAFRVLDIFVKVKECLEGDVKSCTMCSLVVGEGGPRMEPTPLSP